MLDLRTGNAGVSSLPDNTFSKAGFLALERSFPGSSADPAQVVVAGDVGSPRPTAALARLETVARRGLGVRPTGERARARR